MIVYKIQQVLTNFYLDLKIGIGYRCHRVADASFAVGDQKFIGYLIDANDGTR